MKCRDVIDYGSAGCQVLSSALVATLSGYHRVDEMGNTSNLNWDTETMVRVMFGVTLYNVIFLFCVLYSAGRRYGNETAEFYRQDELPGDEVVLLGPTSDHLAKMPTPPSKLDITSAVIMSFGISGIASASAIDFFYQFVVEPIFSRYEFWKKSSLGFWSKMGIDAGPFFLFSYIGFLYQFLLKTPFNVIPDNGFLGAIKKQIIFHPYLIIRSAVILQMILIGATGFKQSEQDIPEGFWRSFMSYGVTSMGAACFYIASVYSGLKGVNFLDSGFNLEGTHWLYRFEASMMKYLGSFIAFGTTMFKLYTSFLSISPAIESMLNGFILFFDSPSISIVSPYKYIIPATILFFSVRTLYAKLAPKQPVDTLVADNKHGFLSQLKSNVCCCENKTLDYA